MYLTVSIGPSHMESPTGFSQAPPTLNTLTAFPYISLKKLLLVLPPNFSSLEPSKPPPKIHKILIGPESPPLTIFPPQTKFPF